MQRMWRQMFTAVAGLLTVVGTASAQGAPPKSLPPLPPLPAIPLAPSIEWDKKAPLASPTSTAPASVVPTAGGYAADVAAPVVGVPAAPVAMGRAPIQSAQYGPGCANGCGNFKSDLGFMFGSCKSFFEPCGPTPCNGGHCGKARFGCKACGIHPFGQPYGTVYNGCGYDSYLNH